MGGAVFLYIVDEIGCLLFIISSGRLVPSIMEFAIFLNRSG
jgi:hypothetical protein